MEDKLKQELSIGDTVTTIMSRANVIDISIIISFIGKMINLKSTKDGIYYSKYPFDVIKIDEQIKEAKNNNPEFYI